MKFVKAVFTESVQMKRERLVREITEFLANPDSTVETQLLLRVVYGKLLNGKTEALFESEEKKEKVLGHLMNAIEELTVMDLKPTFKE